jgi:hypothetical protein
MPRSFLVKKSNRRLIRDLASFHETLPENEQQENDGFSEDVVNSTDTPYRHLLMTSPTSDEDTESGYMLPWNDEDTTGG